MMELSVEKLLTEWGFQNLIALFEEHEINMEAFDSLTEKEITELIPKVGPRILFLKKYNIYKAPCILSDTDTETNFSENSSLSLASFDDNNKVCERAEFHTAIVGVSQNELINSPFLIELKEKHNRCAEKLKLKEIFNSSIKGKAVLNYYKTNNELKESMRDTIVEILILAELQDDFDKRIHTSRFEEFANGIVGVFPNEIKEIYFATINKRTSEGKIRTLGSGKLFRKFYNMRRTLKQGNLLVKRKLSDSSNENIDTIQDEDVIWLKHNLEPWTDVVARWKTSFSKRKHLCNETTILRYYTMFPALKLKLGYTLLEIDFHNIYPSIEEDTFTNEFSSFAKKIVQYAKKSKNAEIRDYLLNLSSDEDLPIDLYYLRLLNMLPLLVKPVTVTRNKKGISWRPTKKEMTDGFIMHVKDITDLKSSIEIKKNKLKSFGLTFQPTPVVVGENLTAINSCYIAFDDILYEIPTIGKTIDICFKITHALKANYPYEAGQLWLIVQKGIYGLQTEWDGNFVGVETILRSF